MHLYLNGIYWGIYSVHERPDQHFTADYLGGEEEDWDVLKHTLTIANLVSGKTINPAQAVSVTNHTAGVDYQQLLNLAAANLADPNYATLGCAAQGELEAITRISTYYVGEM